MKRNFAVVAALGLMGGVSLLAGCTSNQPYPLTGNTSDAEVRERARWIDDKGHYRPELQHAVTVAGPRTVAR